MDFDRPVRLHEPRGGNRLYAQFMRLATVILALAATGLAFHSYVEQRYRARLVEGLIAPGPAVLSIGQNSLQFNVLLEILTTPVEDAQILAKPPPPRLVPPPQTLSCPSPPPPGPLLRRAVIEACSAPRSSLVSAVADAGALQQPPLRLQPAMRVPDAGAGRSERVWLSNTYRPGDPRLISVVAAGDVMMGSAYPSRAGLNPGLRPGTDAARIVGPDLAAIFRAADVAFVNLEGPLFDGPGGTTKNCANCFAFRSPETYAEILASLGLDVVSLANNHSGDFGVAGRVATISSLKRAGIAAAGLVRGDARTASLILTDGRRVGVAAFAPNVGTLSLNDVPAAQTIVRRLAASHDFVVVSFHGGAEGWGATRVPGGTEYYLGENRGAVTSFAHRMIDAGASLVVGHGPHVPRALEIYRGKLIAYSLGNFWTYGVVMNYAVSGLGPVVEAWLAPDGTLAGVQIHSTRQAGLGVPHLDPLNEAARYMMYLTRQDFPATEALLTQDRRLIAAGASEQAQLFAASGS